MDRLLCSCPASLDQSKINASSSNYESIHSMASCGILNCGNDFVLCSNRIHINSRSCELVEPVVYSHIRYKGHGLVHNANSGVYLVYLLWPVRLQAEKSSRGT